MNVTLTGATGFIGGKLTSRLIAERHSVHLLGRVLHKGAPPGVRFSTWNATRSEPPEESLAGADAVINLAGEPVAQRWTPAIKQRILDSRIDGTRRLVGAMGRLPVRPGVLISASAVGIYGSRGDEILTENSPPGHGFLSEVCQAWEAESGRAERWGVRVANLRLGVVLGREGGALPRMLLPFRIGLGGVLGTGEQWMSWIHVEDVIRMFLFLIQHGDARGTWNATAPYPVTNREFTRALGSVLTRPAVTPTPAFALKMLFGEGAEVALSSQRVMPAAAQAAGFEFRYPELRGALKNLLG